MPGPKAPHLRFEESYRIDLATGCWLWTGHRASNGYALIKIWGWTVLSHRYAHKLYKGPIPEGMEILHSCDVRHCVNPAHLSIGTHQQNMKEAAERGRMPSGASHPAFGKPNPRRGANSSQSIQVIVLGKPFGSIKQAEKHFGLGAGSVRYWLNKSSPKARVISKKEYLKYAKSV